MAQHIDSVASSSIPKVSQADFLTQAFSGDLIFCWGHGDLLSEGIEDFTKGPSHVLKIWRPWAAFPFLTLEALPEWGVCYRDFGSNYLSYKGDIVLCRRPLTQLQIEAELEYSTTLLQDKYDWPTFASIVARKFDPKAPVIEPPNEYFCSALQQIIAAKSIPYNIPPKPYATPGQLFTEGSVSPVCALLEGSK